ncbi:hypothetical protein [Microbacterium sp. TPD7012]|uniref:hypothetical protein n=1 Tax=Microbacterium sp. TPD7012 TaxID=2171975 RepID=UPI000D50A184|nr:hypothetical protein [Microbacterium sp. TPD7012]PVE94132.1 hypothetical protein DC434_15365 [Microbacterium sp. TPD7012]
MPTAEQNRNSMPPILIVALTVVSVILLAVAVAFAPVALFTIAWGSPVGWIGTAVWLVIAVLTVLVMLGRSWARFGMLLLPAALGYLAVLSGGVGFFALMFLAAGMALVAVLLMFHSSSKAYFRAVGARGRDEGAYADADADDESSEPSSVRVERPSQ